MWQFTKKAMMAWQTLASNGKRLNIKLCSCSQRKGGKRERRGVLMNGVDLELWLPEGACVT